ncbi:MAG: DarT ssDNA thymidine ADP-ribosyltransferase family protein [Anaerolineae bacterium]
MATIFISYAREDGRALALRLRDDLNNAGHLAWLDTSEIQGGADWARHIEDAIERCDLMLALLSAASYTSDYCRAEQLRAQRKSKRIVPVLVQPDAERPLYLEHLNYFDFSNDAVYDAQLYVLLSDIAGRSVAAVAHPTQPAAFIPAQPPSAALSALDEKPDADAFSRHLERLREETWLGGRYWWPYFLFYPVDVAAVVEILQRGKLLASKDEITADRWKDFVHLDFRPRTPTLWRREGIRPASKRQPHDLHLPVYLMFDFEALIRRADSRFSAGDIYRLRQSFKRAADFRMLPFEQIYHDSWFAAEERDEIMLRRQAVVMVPKQLGLEHLRLSGAVPRPSARPCARCCLRPNGRSGRTRSRRAPTSTCSTANGPMSRRPNWEPPTSNCALTPATTTATPSRCGSRPRRRAGASTNGSRKRSCRARPFIWTCRR